MKQFDVYITRTEYLVVLNINAEDKLEARGKAFERIETGHYNLCGKVSKVTDTLEIDKFKGETNETK